MKINWRILASDLFIIIAIVAILITLLFINDIHNQSVIDQQIHEIRSELCKDYFTHITDTQHIVLSEPEFIVSKSGEYICKIKLGKNCSSSTRQHNNKIFTIDICEQVAYARLKTGMYER